MGTSSTQMLARHHPAKENRRKGAKERNEEGKDKQGQSSEEKLTSCSCTVSMFPQVGQKTSILPHNKATEPHRSPQHARNVIKKSQRATYRHKVSGTKSISIFTCDSVHLWSVRCALFLTVILLPDWAELGSTQGEDAQALFFPVHTY